MRALSRAGSALALLFLAGVCTTSAGQDSGTGGNHNYLRLTGSADWELFRSQGVAGGQRSTFGAFRQRYGIDLAGSIWDYRFNRFLVGLDLFHDKRDVNDQSMDSTSIGYRLESTFFPNRAFPLRLFARRSTIGSTGLELADNDRENGAWGVDWNLTGRNQRNARMHFTRTTYDLLSPVTLQERRMNGVVELSQRSRRRESSFRYGYSEQRELVRDAQFTRHDFMLSDRTRFDNGVVLLFNGTHTLSDARFALGERDDLTQSRLSTSLDIPRKKRAGFSIGYDFSENSGRFVDSTSHLARSNLRVLLGHHWETIFGASMGTLESRTSSATRTQDTKGATLGLRYNRDWTHLGLAMGYTAGVSRTTFDVESERTVTNYGADLHVRVPAGDGSSLFGSAMIRKNENDATGVGFTYDEAVVRVGVEADIGDKLRGQLAAYRRDSTYDTFQFGVQESTEHGIEGTLSQGRGSLSVSLAVREGISEFIPDPFAGGPFLPGTDLVSSADTLTAGTHWRILRRLSVRVQGRYESRDFVSIGKESILSYRPEVEWSPGVWRLIFGVTHYGRDGSTSFEQDTLVLKASRRFF